MIDSPEVSFETIIASIAPICYNLSPICVAYRFYPISKAFVFSLDEISLVFREISVIFLLGYSIHGVAY